MTGKADYKTFMQMLAELNQYIAEEYDKEYILEIRAIGGFSLIVHKQMGNLKAQRNESRDIDSLTRDFPKEIQQKIKEIGTKYKVDDSDGWLNNHWNQTKKYQEEFEYFIKWKRLQEAEFSNIRIYYADIESLFMFKIRAIDDRIHLAKREPRSQDVYDALSILRTLNIGSLDNIKNREIASTIEYFPYAVNYLIENQLIAGAKRQIGTETEKQDALVNSSDGLPCNDKESAENKIKKMEDTWEAYFAMPKEKRNGIVWNGKRTRIAVFEDMYIALCSESSVKPLKQISEHFWKNCVGIQGYAPQYCDKQRTKDR